MATGSVCGNRKTNYKASENVAKEARKRARVTGNGSSGAGSDDLPSHLQHLDPGTGLAVSTLDFLDFLCLQGGPEPLPGRLRFFALPPSQRPPVPLLLAPISAGQMTLRRQRVHTPHLQGEFRALPPPKIPAPLTPPTPPSDENCPSAAPVAAATACCGEEAANALEVKRRRVSPRKSDSGAGTGCGHSDLTSVLRGADNGPG